MKKRESLKNMFGFLVKHYKGKNKEEIQKTKLQKHVERKLFVEKKRNIFPKRN